MLISGLMISFFGGFIQAAVGTVGGLGDRTLEALRMGGEGRFEGRGAVQGQLLIVTVMHRLRRHKADATVAMLSVVPVEERLAVDSSVFDGFEALWEVGPIFTFYLTGDLSSAQTSCEASETGCRARVCLSMVYNRIGRHDDAAANLELITTQGV